LKVIRQGIVLWAQLTQDALGVLIDVLEPGWGMPAGVETNDDPIPPEPAAIRDPAAQRVDISGASWWSDTAYRGTW
jgi:hypothetical protein